MSIIAYIRVSTSKQDVESQKIELYEYARKEEVIITTFVEVTISSQRTPKERKIDELYKLLQTGDTLLVSELSRLGRSVGQIIQIIDTLVKRGVHFIAIKENLKIKDSQDIQTKIMVTLLGLFAEIERDLISERTKQGLAVAREKGKVLGRPRGKGRSKLDKHKGEILNLLENGSSKAFISRKFNTAYSNLHSWLKYQKS